MIEEIKYKEVEIVEPGFVEYFIILYKDKKLSIDYRWSLGIMSTNITYITNELKHMKKNWHSHYEYKILSIKLPA